MEAVRVTIGAGGATEAGICGYCDKHINDLAGAHASCCAIGEATKAHNAIRDIIFAFSAEADNSTEREPEGLVASQPRARPADVLSPAAIPGRVAALDI